MRAKAEQFWIQLLHMQPHLFHLLTVCNGSVLDPPDVKVSEVTSDLETCLFPDWHHACVAKKCLNIAKLELLYVVLH